MSTIKDVLHFRQVFTKLFDEINLLDMLYEYYYCQWSITLKGILSSNFNIVRNSVVLSDTDFQQIMELEDNKYYLCYNGGGFRFVKKISGGYKFYGSSPLDKDFDVYTIKDDNNSCTHYYKFCEIPLDFYHTVSEELQKLDNSRCLLL